MIAGKQDATGAAISGPASSHLFIQRRSMKGRAQKWRDI
jgi:hypothetical protein